AESKDSIPPSRALANAGSINCRTVSNPMEGIEGEGIPRVISPYTDPIVVIGRSINATAPVASTIATRDPGTFDVTLWKVKPIMTVAAAITNESQLISLKF